MPANTDHVSIRAVFQVKIAVQAVPYMMLMPFIGLELLSDVINIEVAYTQLAERVDVTIEDIVDAEVVTAINYDWFHFCSHTAIWVY
jgi:hypothetical protein